MKTLVISIALFLSVHLSAQDSIIGTWIGTAISNKSEIKDWLLEWTFDENQLYIKMHTTDNGRDKTRDRDALNYKLDKDFLTLYFGEEKSQFKIHILSKEYLVLEDRDIDIIYALHKKSTNSIVEEKLAPNTFYQFNDYSNEVNNYSICWLEYRYDDLLLFFDNNELVRYAFLSNKNVYHQEIYYSKINYKSIQFLMIDKITENQITGFINGKIPFELKQKDELPSLSVPIVESNLPFGKTFKIITNDNTLDDYYIAFTKVMNHPEINLFKSFSSLENDEKDISNCLNYQLPISLFHFPYIEMYDNGISDFIFDNLNSSEKLKGVINGKVSFQLKEEVLKIAATEKDFANTIIIELENKENVYILNKNSRTRKITIGLNKIKLNTDGTGSFTVNHQLYYDGIDSIEISDTVKTVTYDIKWELRHNGNFLYLFHKHLKKDALNKEDYLLLVDVYHIKKEQDNVWSLWRSERDRMLSDGDFEGYYFFTNEGEVEETSEEGGF